MAGKKPEEVKEGLPEWMGTYGDLVTLLLCFFVLLFAMSNVDENKYNAVAESFNSSITFVQGGGATGVNNMLGSGINNLPKVDKSVNDSKNDQQQKESQELNKMASDFKTYFAENNVAENVTVEVTDDYLKITFGDGILFDSGSAVLKDDALSVLGLIADELVDYPGSQIKFEGYTDNQPINSAMFPDNMYLSAARSISVLNYFKNTYNMDPQMLSQEGFGEYRPVATNDTPEGRAKNRRVEVKIMSQYSDANDAFDDKTQTDETATTTAPTTTSVDNSSATGTTSSSGEIVYTDKNQEVKENIVPNGKVQ